MAADNTANLSGRVALITGAARGIGRAIASTMAKRGAEVMLVDINEDTLAGTIDAFRAAGHTVTGWVADVADPEGVAAVLGKAAERVDILVNNAGISGQEAAFADIDGARFDRMMDIHVKGAFFLTQLVVPGMVARRFGRIVNISSNRGMVGYRRSSHYCAAKAALLGLTKAWAKEFAPHNILVNAVAPGVVFTEMNTWNGMAPLEDEASWNLLQRWAEPEEIAYTVAFLASQETAFMTGQVLCPNGGDPIVGI